MKKNLIFLALAAMGLASCNGGYKQGENGLLYTIYTDKSGPKIKEGDFVLAQLVIKRDDDSVLLSTYEQGRPTPVILPKPQFKGDIFDAIKLLAEGDSASFKINADTVFKKGQRPPTFKGKYLNYQLKIVKVIAKGAQTDQVFQAAVTKYMNELSEAEKAAEPAKIKKYIADNKLNTNKTDSGLYYVITKPGSGALIAKGDTAVIHYTGRLLSGKVFDTSVKSEAVKAKLPGVDQRPYTPIRVAVGERKVIPGWDQGLQLLNKGAKATFVIPSALAYGAQGAGNIIPAYTPIVFDLEVIDVVHPKAGAVAPAAPVASLPIKK